MTIASISVDGNCSVLNGFNFRNPLGVKFFVARRALGNTCHGFAFEVCVVVPACKGVAIYRTRIRCLEFNGSFNMISCSVIGLNIFSTQIIIYTVVFEQLSINGRIAIRAFLNYLNRLGKCGILKPASPIILIVSRVCWFIELQIGIIKHRIRVRIINLCAAITHIVNRIRCYSPCREKFQIMVFGV